MTGRMLRVSLCLICLVLSVTVGRADTEADRLRVLKTAAEAGDPAAQYSLALRILDYCVLSREQQDEAIGWLRAAADRPRSTAADQPVGKAQFKLAEFYEVGRFVEQDIDEALLWYRRAADNRVVEAMIRLAEAYMVRSGAQTPDSAARIQWLERAANLGSVEAATDLGMLYVHGDVVPRDYAEARKWFLKSAPVTLGKYCGPFQSSVRGLYGCHAAEYLGTFFARGLGTPQDYEAARSWFEAAARNYSPYSDYSLGVMYEHGQGVAKDSARALAYYLASAESGFTPAQYRLGLAYLAGHGVSVDPGEALKWFALVIADLSISQPRQESRLDRWWHGRGNDWRVARGGSDSVEISGKLDIAAYNDAFAKVNELSQTLDPQEIARAKASMSAFKLRQPRLPRTHPVQPPPPRCRPQP